MKSSPDKDKTEKLAEEIVGTYEGDTGINFIDVSNLPARDKILEILDLLIELIFPGYAGTRTFSHHNIKFVVGDILCRIRTELSEQAQLALRHNCKLENCQTDDCITMAADATDHLLNRLPAIREMLKGDVQAAYNGDPAAKSFEEIVISYPYIIAIATHRIAHELYLRHIPLIPRIMSESAHSKTGIDVHPGARIGKNFFIDHGTGVVIGETTIIGDNVKLYQGVTLGALSFPKDERGRVIKGGKRHPTIEDDVTIYAEATILGDVTIGTGATISGNVWLTHSVAPGVTVAMEKPRSLYRQHKDNNQYHGLGSNI